MRDILDILGARLFFKKTQTLTKHVWLISYPTILEFLVADISLNIICKELKIVYITEVNSNLARCLLYTNLYANEIKCKHRQQRFL